MYKHVALLVRKDGMTHESFLDYWRNTHTPIAREIEGVARYQHVYPVSASSAEFDGIAELSFSDLDALYDALGSEGSRDYDPEAGMAQKARADVDNFLAIERRPRFIGEEIIELDSVDGDTDGLYKHSAFLVRKNGMSYDAFLDHWANEHVPLAREIPGVVRYVRVVPTNPDAAEFDGIAELYFEDLDALRAGLGHGSSRDYDPEHPKAAAPREDVDTFLSIDDRPRFIGRERVIKDETNTE